MATLFIQLAFAIAAGIATSFQPGINRAFADVAGDRLWGGVINFGVGFLTMLSIVTALRPPIAQASKFAAAPWWIWTGGMLGAFFVTTAIFLIRPLGAANYVAAMIAGQFLGSMVIDHFGLLGVVQHSFTPGRFAGLVFIVVGMVFLRYF
jgi:transporter family-2 protein